MKTKPNTTREGKKKNGKKTEHKALCIRLFIYLMEWMPKMAMNTYIIYIWNGKKHITLSKEIEKMIVCGLVQQCINTIFRHSTTIDTLISSIWKRNNKSFAEKHLKFSLQNINSLLRIRGYLHNMNTDGSFHALHKTRVCVPFWISWFLVVIVNTN